jgi:predicted esterase
MAVRVVRVALLGAALGWGCGAGRGGVALGRAPASVPAPPASTAQAAGPAPTPAPPAAAVGADPTFGEPYPGALAAPAPPEPAPPSPLPPLDAPSALAELEIPGHLAALVALPLGARSPRPVVVVTHGAGGRPEGLCRLWQTLVGSRAFVLCLRGISANRLEPPDRTGYYYPGHPALGVELGAALGALGARYGDHVDMRAPLYVGFSQGASMGALLLPSHPAGFARAVLIEGGYGLYQEWNVAAARAFHEHGGERVVLACGRLRCLEQAQHTARQLEHGGLRVRVLYARGVGHGYGGAMEQELRANLAWLVEGDPRF